MSYVDAPCFDNCERIGRTECESRPGCIATEVYRTIRTQLSLECPMLEKFPVMGRIRMYRYEDRTPTISVDVELPRGVHVMGLDGSKLELALMGRFGPGVVGEAMVGAPGDDRVV